MITLPDGSSPRRKYDSATGFTDGINNFQDEQLISSGSLTEAKNIILDVDGISPRYGTENLDNAIGGSEVQGSIQYNKVGVTPIILAVSGGVLKKKVGNSWSTISGATYDTSADVNFVVGNNRAYIFNGVDNLSYTDGSSITVFTNLTTPTGQSCTPQGTTGSTSYSYIITAVNDMGETLGSSAANTSTGTSTLNATNYNRVTWTAVSGATKYNIYGRKSTGKGQTFMETTFTNSYNDKGQATPTSTIIPPTVNRTEGIICKKGVYAASRLFAAGDSTNPSRLYYSGVGEYFGVFGLSIDPESSAEIGGYWVDVYEDDGQEIRDIQPFQGGVIIFKDQSIYKFSFVNATISDSAGIRTVSTPQLEEITRTFGGVSFRGSYPVENDLIFPSVKHNRIAFYSLGNQENYSGSVLRTNELSIKAEKKLEDVNLNKTSIIASAYYRNLYMCSIPKSGSEKNNRIWVLDTRFGSWVYWDDLSARGFTELTALSGHSGLFYDSNTTSYMVEMFKDDRNDNGVAISAQADTKAFNQDSPHIYKQYYDPVIQVKGVNRSGTIDGEIYIDGAVIDGSFTINQQSTGGAGVGADMVGFMTPGDATEGVSSGEAASSDIIQSVYYSGEGRSIKYSFKSNELNLNYKILSIITEYEALSEMSLKENQRTYSSG